MSEKVKIETDEAIESHEIPEEVDPKEVMSFLKPINTNKNRVGGCVYGKGAVRINNRCEKSNLMGIINNIL